LNTYIVLLRRMEGRTEQAKSPRAAANVLCRIAEATDVQILDVFSAAGIFDAAIVCRALSNAVLARFLDKLDGWHTDALLSTAHVRWETDSAAFLADRRNSDPQNPS
jgi:hypothetical protein